MRHAAATPLGCAAVDLFEQQWPIYRRVVEADLMEHAALTAATAAAVRRWLTSRAAAARLPVT
jgi:hypothetical protein